MSAGRRAVLDAAIDWRLRLDAGDADAGAFENWLRDDPEHAQVWERLAALDARVAGVGTRGGELLQRARRERGRRSRRALATLLLVAGVLLPLAERQWPLAQLAADHVTATGERRALRLADGTAIQLDARSALDVDFDARQRRLTLRTGRLWVETAHGDSRPFVVATAEGSLRALGTRFLVQRDGAGRTELTVLEAAVEATAPDGATQVLRAGQRIVLEGGGLSPIAAADAGAAAWTRDMLAVENARLADVVAEFSRHTTAYLSVDARVADLPVTGAFPLGDIERSLASLTETLPVAAQRRTPLWVRLAPREE